MEPSEHWQRMQSKYEGKSNKDRKRDQVNVYSHIKIIPGGLEIPLIFEYLLLR